MNKRKIKYIEALKDSVYIEYTDFDSAYISFTKAKKLLKADGADELRYACSDNQKSVDFINKLTFYSRSGSDDILIKIKKD